MLKKPINQSQFVELSKIMKPQEILQKYKLVENIQESKKPLFTALSYVLGSVCLVLLIGNIFQSLLVSGIYLKMSELDKNTQNQKNYLAQLEIKGQQESEELKNKAKYDVEAINSLSEILKKDNQELKTKLEKAELDLKTANEKFPDSPKVVIQQIPAKETYYAQVMPLSDTTVNYLNLRSQACGGSVSEIYFGSVVKVLGEANTNECQGKSYTYQKITTREGQTGWILQKHLQRMY